MPEIKSMPHCPKRYSAINRQNERLRNTLMACGKLSFRVLRTGSFCRSQVPKKTVMQVMKNSTPKRAAQRRYWAGFRLSLIISVGTRPQTMAPSVDQTMRMLENFARIV